MRITIAPLALVAGIFATSLIACGDKDSDTGEEAVEAEEQEAEEGEAEESEEEAEEASEEEGGE